MLVSYNDFQLNNEPFIDGANMYSIENSMLIKEFEGNHFKAKPHNVRAILSGKESLAGLKSNDVVVSNVGGPYAWVYHYIREKKGLKFRIVRDVQTSFWQGYFLQETLCGPYTREGDAILFLSEFQRQLFISLFPEHLNEENTFVCAPFMHFFPREFPKKEKDYDGLTLGWVGRVTAEKGFHIALESFIRLRKELKNVRMVVAGGRTPKTLEKWIFRTLRKNGISNDALVWLNDRKFMPHSSVWDAYKAMDVFLFPSVSHNESLGRVMVEAAYCKLPVIAAHYAAAPEIIDAHNLVPVTYKKGLIQLAGITNMGRVDEDVFIRKIIEHKKLSNKTRIMNDKNHDLKYANILKGEQKKERQVILDNEIERLIKGVKLYQNKPSIPNDLCFERLRKFMINENYAILSLWHFYIPAYMGYNPYALLFANDNRNILERACLKLQKGVMLAKNPIKTPLKMGYYLKHKRFADKNRY